MIKADGLKENNSIWKQSKRKYHRNHIIQSDQSSLIIFTDQKLLLRDVEFPKCLVDLLIIDRDLVTKKHYLQKLPSVLTVTKVLNQFEEFVLNQYSEYKRYEVVEFVECFMSFFNVILPKAILYRFERRQYTEFVRKICDNNDQIKYSSYYGPLCLLRAVFKLQNYIHDVYGRKTPEIIDSIYYRLRIFIQIFVNYLAENREKMFILIEMYELASSAYIEDSKFN